MVKEWEEATGGLLVEGYGMTETSPVALGNPIGPTRRPGTVGVPFPTTEIRVVDPERPDRRPRVDEEGELLIRGPQVFAGYWNRPQETAEVLLPDGWLRTGDIVRVSSDGFVTIVDRVKELIITGGFNVSPVGGRGDAASYTPYHRCRSGGRADTPAAVRPSPQQSFSPTVRRSM